MNTAGLLVALFIAVATPLAAQAQQTPKVPRVGVLCNTAPPLVAFRAGLRELGYVEGQNILVEYRCAEGRIERGAALGAELLQFKPDVLVGASDTLVKALRQLTATIPIVMTSSGDPVGNGFVASLRRPGGNITGMSLVAPELAGKRLELLKAIVPRITRLGALVNPTNPNAARQLSETEAAAKAAGLQLQPVDVRDANQFESAFVRLSRERVGGVVVQSDPMFFAERKAIADLAIRTRLPVIGWSSEFAAAGCVVTYGPNLPASYRRAAAYVDKILKGARPGDLAVEQPTTFELIVNLNTAKALGLTIPQSILVRADEVIQ